MLADELECKENSNRLKGALGLLRMAQLSAPAPVGQTSAEDIIRELVDARMAAKQAERDRHLSQTDRLLASMRTPSKEEYDAEERLARAQVCAELQAKLAEETVD